MDVKTKFNGSISERMKQMLIKDLQKMLLPFSFSEAELAMTVKTQEQKNLVEVHANLHTDRGRFHSRHEGFQKNQVCIDALDSIGAQLKKQII